MIIRSLYIRWNIDPEIFNLFGIPVRYYGLLFASGLVGCWYVIKYIFEKESIPQQFLDKLFLYGVMGIFIGARLGHCLFYEPSYFLQHPLEIFIPFQQQPGGGYHFTGYQGLASHGGTIGLALAIFFFSKKSGISLLKILDIVGIVAPLGAMFIRLANLMNSEILGIQTNLPWAFIFSREDNYPRHPAQLYEAICYAIFFLILIRLYLKRIFPLQTGLLLGLSIVLIFTARFFIEFIKEKQVAFEQQMQLDMGQLLSIPFVIIGAGLMYYGFQKKKQQIA